MTDRELEIIRDFARTLYKLPADTVEKSENATPPPPLYGDYGMARATVIEDEPRKKVKKANYSTKYLLGEMQSKLIDQNAAIERIVPYLTLFGSGLCDTTKPVATFLLLGNSGVGKTRTVEVLADVLHGEESRFIKIDCGEFQHSHEMAKLVGAPPGYLGHRETQPIITQAKLNGMSSEGCPLSIVLFDEIEKAHFALNNLLLGVLDKGTLRLGDNNEVSFHKSLVFFTSNLSSKKITDMLNPNMGFSTTGKKVSDSKGLIGKLGAQSVVKHFSPEFVNRLDEIITYNPLSKEAIAEIFGIAIRKVRYKIAEKFLNKDIFLVLTDEAKEFLITEGFSETYGARELNRIIQKKLVNPLANLLTEEEVKPSSFI